MSVVGRVLRRIGGRSWLVLSAGLPTFSDLTPGLSERLLERIDLGLPPLVVRAPAVEAGPLERLLSDLEDLLGIAAEHVPAARVPAEAWAAAGMVVLAGGPEAAWLEALQAAGGPDLAEELPDGALIYAAGPAARALGGWVCQEGRPADPGAAWLPGAIVLPGVDAPGSVPEVRQCLVAHPRAYAVGLPAGAILALGPEGQVESWGPAQPAIALGKGWLDE